MKIYTVIGIYEDVYISEYGSYRSREEAKKAAEEADHFENEDFYEQYAKHTGEWTDDDLRQKIAMDGTVIHIIESELQED